MKKRMIHLCLVLLGAGALLFLLCLAPLGAGSLFSPLPIASGETNVLASPLPLLVNQASPVSEDFVPADLVRLTEVLNTSLIRVKYKKTTAVRAAAAALETMIEAAAADGVKKWQVSAAYRSISDQKSLLNAKISSYLEKNPGWSRSRARSAALKSVAEPGYSEHHLGLAFDVNVPGASAFKGTKQCKWLHEHCWDYGFIIRYPEGKESITGYIAEPWHIRYVGTAHAQYMRDHDLCLEEYLQGLWDGSILSPVSMTVEEIPVPE